MNKQDFIPVKTVVEIITKKYKLERIATCNLVAHDLGLAGQTVYNTYYSNSIPYPAYRLMIILYTGLDPKHAPKEQILEKFKSLDIRVDLDNHDLPSYSQRGVNANDCPFIKAKTVPLEDCRRLVAEILDEYNLDKLKYLKEMIMTECGYCGRHSLHMALGRVSMKYYTSRLLSIVLLDVDPVDKINEH